MEDWSRTDFSQQQIKEDYIIHLYIASLDLGEVMLFSSGRRQEGYIFCVVYL